MKLKSYLITLALLFIAFGVRAEGDEAITIHLNSSETPTQIAIADVSKIVFETTQFNIKNNKNGAVKYFDYSDVIKITFNEELNTESIEVVDANATLALFPNPAKDYLTINDADDLHGSDLCIHSLTGSLISKQTNWNGEKINVSHLNPGIYFIKLNSTTLKFIKQ